MEAAKGASLRDVRRGGGREGRFELDDAGVTSFADYRLALGQLVIEHVETPAAARGGGAAGRLMAAIVAHAASAGLEIVPECGYAAAWLRRNQRATGPPRKG